MKWFDTMIYKLFYWRWNKKFIKDKGLRDLFRAHLNSWEEKEIKKCEFYPTGDESVCDCGSDVAGPILICTNEYSLTCRYANERRRQTNNQ